MNTEDKYQTWIKRKTKFEAGEDFAGQVMGRITQYEQGKGKPLFDIHQFYERISAHPLGKLGLIAACAVIGFVRIALTLRMICG